MPRARSRRQKLFTWVWLIPIVAAFTVLWLGWQSLQTRGPLITISFDDAEGLDEGHTPVRYKSVQVGLVESVGLSKDLGKVVVTARMDRRVAASLTEHAQFWVVKPRFSAAGVSGLSTLLSGSYIEMEPGPGGPASKFVGLEDPPVVQSQVPGTRFTLEATQLGSLDQGSPVYYRGLQVGEVLGDNLRDDGRNVEIYVFVRKPYDRLVRADSHFWNASGVSVGTTGTGIKANIGSLQTLLAGGIAFNSPPDGPELVPGSGDGRFILYDDEVSAEEAPTGPVLPYLARFPGIVHGLGIGAAVEMNGVKIGQVTGLHLEYDLASGTLATPVSLELQPDCLQIAGQGPAGPTDFAAVLERLARAGLRARLASASLLTGSLLVSLEVVPGAEPAAMTLEKGVPLIPSVPAGSVDQLMRSATALVDSLRVPLPQLMAHLAGVVANLDRLTGSPALRDATGTLARTLANLQQLTAATNVALPPLLASLRQTADAATRTADAADRIVGGDPASTGHDVPAMMRELTAAARSIRDLADFLDQHPDALLRGRRGP
jgi:paraquat-inducible protein B